MDDWKAVHDWAKLADSCRYQGWGPNTEAETRAFVERSVADWEALAVRSRVYVAMVDGEVLGSGVVHIRHRFQAQGEISYSVHPKVWGRGLGTVIAKKLLHIGFTELGLHRIFGTCDPRNLASVSVLKKVGMHYEGLMRHTMKIDGGWRDSQLYAILAPEWAVG